MKTIRDDKEFYSDEGKKKQGGDYCGSYTDAAFSKTGIGPKKGYKYTPNSEVKNKKS